jgi:16S rRNA G966 N2-methylase RsmD
VETYTSPGQTVLDPFCGSGTLLVEALTLGRNAIGIDIDPMAALASTVKTQRLQPGRLRASVGRLQTALERHRRDDVEYRRRQFHDLSESKFYSESRRLKKWIPELPNIFHWFRRYVIIDLATIRRTIEHVEVPETHRHLFRLCFAASVRKASNADPVPVSGLEVTKHMRALDRAGRVVNPYRLFELEIDKACVAFDELWETAAANAHCRAFQCDARDMTKRLRARKVDVAITSPPYHGAVDYYRRHTLEAYWMGFAITPEDRLRLLPKYIGRAKVPMSHEYANTVVLAGTHVGEWERKIRSVDAQRADAFRHYALSMQAALSQLAEVLPPGAPAVLVVGNSRWRGEEMDTSQLLFDVCKGRFRLLERCWYSLKNRYMSYARHNGANIDREHVLVLERR